MLSYDAQLLCLVSKLANHLTLQLYVLLISGSVSKLI